MSQATTQRHRGLKMKFDQYTKHCKIAHERSTGESIIKSILMNPVYKSSSKSQLYSQHFILKFLLFYIC